MRLTSLIVGNATLLWSSTGMAQMKTYCLEGALYTCVGLAVETAPSVSGGTDVTVHLANLQGQTVPGVAAQVPWSRLYRLDLLAGDNNFQGGTLLTDPVVSAAGGATAHADVTFTWFTFPLYEAEGGYVGYGLATDYAHGGADIVGCALPPSQGYPYFQTCRADGSPAEIVFRFSTEGTWQASQMALLLGFHDQYGTDMGCMVAGALYDDPNLWHCLEIGADGSTNHAPTASAGGPYTATEGTPMSLALGGTDPDQDALSYAWDLGDGTTGTGATLPTTHVYADNGSYSISLTATDSKGASDTKTTSVGVVNAAPTLGDVTGPTTPLGVGVAANISASFTDPGALDTHSASVNWGDGITSAATVAGANTDGTLSASHSYATAGVYSVTATVTDKDNATSNGAVFQYVVVYDPAAGFVTGAGWIDSPAGACQWSGCAADGSTTGKATFGFEARYQKSATLPSGTTQFQFKAGGLAFASTSYQWLVVSGARAQFKGQGTINGGGAYGFLLTAIDGQLSGGGGVDRFRIKIWDLNTSAIVYDNQLGAADDTTDPPTALGGGSIQIHQ